jgi:hypothetical protein
VKVKFQCNLYVRPDLLEVGTLRKRQNLRAPIINGARMERISLPNEISAKFWHLVDVLELVVAQPS